MLDKKKTNAKITLATLKSQMQPMPHPRNTCDFPAGLISDYIRMVDKARKEELAEKDKKSA